MFGVSAISRVTEALQAANASQKSLNAFTSIEDEAALATAERIDDTINSGRYAGPLAGIPLGLKDIIDHMGRITTCGSAFYRQEAANSAPVVAALEAAGAVIIGRTGLHEWAFGFSSENPHFGVIRNPWDLATSPGGSSGGSAAAVAARITPIAIGTDTGGSVRVPAALCGTFGLKVTYSRVPIDGVFPLVSSIDTVGPLADSMENISIAYRVMSGDETVAKPGPLRVGIPQPWYDDSPTSEEVSTAFKTAVSALSDMGHEVHPISMPDVVPSTQIVNAIAGEVTAVHESYRARGERYGKDVAERLDEAASITTEDQAEGKAWQQMIRSRFSDAFATVDLLVSPTVPVRKKVIGEDLIGGQHHRSVISYFSALVNHSLHPALAVPLSRSGSAPVSLQIIGNLGAEPLLIELGRSLESAGVAGFRPAPRIQQPEDR